MITSAVRWPSWLWRQVKVILTLIPGHESGVGSSPTLINIRPFARAGHGNPFFLGGGGGGVLFYLLFRRT